MIDIKLRNVKVEDACEACRVVWNFMEHYEDRRGIRNGVIYGNSHPPFTDSNPVKFYVYRTEKTVICVGDYGVVNK